MVAGSMNVNSAHPFENPTGFTNWLSIFLLLVIPFALTYTFGKMVGSIRHGAALLAGHGDHTSGLGGVSPAMPETRANPAVASWPGSLYL